MTDPDVAAAVAAGEAEPPAKDVDDDAPDLAPVADAKPTAPAEEPPPPTERPGPPAAKRKAKPKGGETFSDSDADV